MCNRRWLMLALIVATMHMSHVTADDSTTVATSVSQVIFEASPKVLKDNLTEEMSMRCAVTNNQNQIHHISAIHITKNRNEAVAFLTSFGGPRAVTDHGNLVANGNLSATSGEGELMLSWVDPGFVDLGTYVCKVTAFDHLGFLVQLTSSLTLTSVPPSINDVMVSFNAKLQETNDRQQETIANMMREIQTLKQKDQQQESEISHLKTCVSTHVAFHASMSYNRFSGYELRINSGQTVVWDHVTLNTGGGYNPSTGVFRCTVPGVYKFNGHIHGAVSEWVRLQLEKNGQALVDLFRDNDPNESDASLSHIVELQAGDVVAVKTTGAVLYQESLGGSVGNVNYFMGHLIRATNCTIRAF